MVLKLIYWSLLLNKPAYITLMQKCSSTNWFHSQRANTHSVPVILQKVAKIILLSRNVTVLYFSKMFLICRSCITFSAETITTDTLKNNHIINSGHPEYAFFCQGQAVITEFTYKRILVTKENAESWHNNYTHTCLLDGH